ncbi:MAG: LamG domain-containing protein, partial [Candidatus Heimdallarchaeaceae archaeon]
QIRLTQHNGSVDLYDNISIKELKTADNTPNSNHGTVYGASVSEDYTSFDGSDDYISVNNADELNFGTNSFSISAWFKTSGEGPTYIITKNTEDYISTPGFNIRMNSSETLTFTVTDGTNHASPWGTIAANDEQWHHVVGVYDGENKKAYLYLDGALDTTYTNANLGSTSNTGNLYIGRNPESVSQVWNGQICNVKIWNRALSEEEIKLLYEKGR